MTKKSKASSFALPKLAPEVLRGRRRTNDPTDPEAAKPAEVIAKIRLLTADEIRAGMLRAMSRAGRRGRVILFGSYSRGDYLSDIDLMVVVDAYRRGVLEDTRIRRQNPPR